MTSRLAVVFFSALMAAASSSAWADAGDIAYGVDLGFGYPLSARGGASLRLGISDAAALRLGGGFAGGYAGPSGYGQVGLVVAADYLRWVPEAYFAVGARYDGLRADEEISFGIGARRYFSRRLSLGPTLGARIVGGSWSAILGVSVLWDSD